MNLENRENLPLSARMRAKCLDDFVGQNHIVGKGSLLRRAISIDKLGSCIFYGPTGCGKTTLATIIANTTNSFFKQLNAVSSGVADAKKVIEEAKLNLALYGKKTYLLLDECHRWSKAQSDCVLSAIENGEIIFVGCTTENPYVNMTKAIVSRCRVFEFRKIKSADIAGFLLKTTKDKENGLGNYELNISDKALEHLAWASDGDLRSGLNALELAFLTTNPDKNGVINIGIDEAVESIQKQALSVDESMYYDMLSAFCKSLRGSDSDAAVYWSQRLIKAGVDPLLIARRLIIHSAEDVGMADPNAFLIATNVLTTLEKVGMPEGNIPLTLGIIYVAEAEKSNSSYGALVRARELIEKYKDDNVPLHLQDANFKSQKVQGYKYPHNFGGYVKQQYLPDSLKDEEIYQPGKNGYEGNLIRKKIR